MSKFNIVLTIAILWNCTLFGQVVKKCDIDILGHVSTAEYVLTEKDRYIHNR